MARMNSAEARTVFQQAEVARLATVTPDGRPHLVPVTFAVREDLVVTAVDHKPKRGKQLQRLRNIAANPSVALLADHYERDWSALWWVRVDGDAELTEAVEHPRYVAELAAKYPQYQEKHPTDALIVVQVRRWTGWRATRT